MAFEAVRSRQPLRLLIVDDSAVARAALGGLLAERDAFAIAGAARNAAEAEDFLARETVDIVLLDLAMPGRDGFDALPDLIAAGQGARVLVVSGAAEDGGEVAVRALTLGAADTIRKPEAGELGPRFAERLAKRLLGLGPARRRRTPAIMPAPRVLRQDPVACLALGASTGGPAALAALLGALPPSFAAPILVTQHLPPEFMPHFAARLGALSGRPARVARAGDPLRARDVLVAPGHAHLGLAGAGGQVRVRLDETPAPSGCRPSVDPMLAATACVFGSSAAGVVLSGMGRDGAAGAAALAAAGGELLAQDAASSAIWGMPGAVARAGLAAAVLAPEAIGLHLGRRGSAAAWS